MGSLRSGSDGVHFAERPGSSLRCVGSLDPEAVPVVVHTGTAYYYYYYYYKKGNVVPVLN
jgi:hypothetical protein